MLHVFYALIVAAVVMLPRSYLISRAHSENMDTQYHLRRGFATIAHNPYGAILPRTDGPLGQVLMELPMFVLGCDPGKPITMANWPAGTFVPGGDARNEAEAMRLRGLRRAFLYGHWLSPEALLSIVCIWKTVLFLPAIAVIFVWTRAVYGLKSAYLALGLFLADPTFTANIAAPALDTFGVAGIIISCYLYWRFFETPTRGRLIAAVISTAAALLMKHTAVLLPPVFVIMLVMHRGESWRIVRKNLLLAVAIGALAIWAFTLFDYSAPNEVMTRHLSFKSDSAAKDIFLSFLERKWPAGVYFGCVVESFGINAAGQNAFLWGEISPKGWWYYFPVVASYKIPFGIFFVLGMGMVSLVWIKPRRAEIYLAIPALAWTLFLLNTNMNYGFRHFMPPYAFMLMLSARCVSGSSRMILISAWIACLAGAIHAASYHPDYLGYFNRKFDKPQAIINDTNIDWGQSLKQVRRWLDEHPTTRPVHLGLRTDESLIPPLYYIGGQFHIMTRSDQTPTSGLLILSPVWEAAIYDPFDRFAMVRPVKPIDVIGHCMSVYDLDQIKEKEHGN